jgi:two-component system sensor histidine kinase KdpD
MAEQATQQRLEGAVRSGGADAMPPDDFLDLAAHDIKNALNVVNSALDMIADDPAEMTDMLPLLRRSSGRIGRLVATLVEVNRLVGGTMPVRISGEPWSRLCEKAMAEVALVAQAKEISFEVRSEQSLIVRCDGPLLERVLTHLIDGALVTAPRGTVVDLRAIRTDGGGVRALVGSRGPAVPSEVLQRSRGWGIGILFCRLAIERLGGTIRPVSPYVGDQGLAFELELPGR